jgi:nicotinamide phosphoribosyltransferase
MSERQYALSMIANFATPGKSFCMVADSYDLFNFCKMLGDDYEIYQKIIGHGSTGGFTVIRPDSGDPVEVVFKVVEILSSKFGTSINSKGYKLLNNVRVLQGDGIDGLMIKAILDKLVEAGYSADNVFFGMGGQNLQKVDRDTQKFALKCSAIKINGTWQAVQKDPITDSGKRSKPGRVTLYKTNGVYHSGVEDWPKSELITVFENGKAYNRISLDEIRINTGL